MKVWHSTLTSSWATGPLGGQTGLHSETQSSEQPFQILQEAVFLCVKDSWAFQVLRWVKTQTFGEEMEGVFINRKQVGRGFIERIKKSFWASFKTVPFYRNIPLCSGSLKMTCPQFWKLHPSQWRESKEELQWPLSAFNEPKSSKLLFSILASAKVKKIVLQRQIGRHEVILWTLFLPDYSGNKNFLGRNVLKT